MGNWKDSFLSRYGYPLTGQETGLSTLYQKCGEAKSRFSSVFRDNSDKVRIELPSAGAEHLWFVVLNKFKLMFGTGIPASSPMQELIDNTMTGRIHEQTGKPYYSPGENTTWWGEKLSKVLLKALKSTVGTTGEILWDYDTTGGSAGQPYPVKSICWNLRERGTLPKLPNPCTPEAFVQNLFSEMAALKCECHLSRQFDDFPGSAETRSFISCFRIGGQREVAPFSLGMSPNVLVILFHKPGAPDPIGRAWLWVNDEQTAFGIFGAYGVASKQVLSAVADKIEELFEWSSSVSAPAPEHFCGNILEKLDKDEPTSNTFDEIVVLRARTWESIPQSYSIDVPPSICPVCGKNSAEFNYVVCLEHMDKHIANAPTLQALNGQ